MPNVEENLVTGNAATHEDPHPGASRSYMTLAALAAILLLAVLLRAHHLRAQSVWYDEYLSAGYLDRPDLMSCLRDQRVENWEMVPLYYILEYYWSHLVGGSIPGVRWLSILFGLAAILVAYRFGRDLYGDCAGLIAALCIALSPFHIFHAQAIRPYAMMTFLALVSFMSFFRAARDGGRRWWILNFITNGLLLWTHLFGALVLIPEGCFLILLRSRRFRWIVFWTGAHLLLIVPTVLWVMMIRQAPPAPLTPPDHRQLLYDLFRDDGVYASWAAGIPDKSHEGTLSDTFGKIIARRRTWEDALVKAYGAAWLILALWTLRSMLGRDSGKYVFGIAPALARKDEGRWAACENLAFLTMIWVLPAVVLWVTSRLWQPVFQERYTVYSPIALYIIAGGAAAGFPRMLPRAMAAAGLVGLIGWQTAASFAISMRPDYLGVATRIRSEATPNDVSLVYTLFHKRIFAFNMGATNIPILLAENPNDAAGQTDDQLDQGHNVWFVLVKAPESANVPEPYERYLALRAIAYTKTVFLGMNNVYLYHCVRDAQYKPPSDADAITALQSAIRQNPNDMALRLRLAHILETAERWDEAIAAYSEAAESAPADAPIRITLGRVLEKQGATEQALDAYRAAATIDPAHGALVYGNALYRMRRVDEAIQTYRDALETLPNDRWLWANLAGVLQNAGRYPEAVDAYRKALEHLPSDAMLHINLGSALELMGQVDEAIQEYRAALQCDSKDPNTYARLGMALKRQERLQEAVEPLRRAAALNIQDMAVRAALVEVFCELKDYAAAWDQVAECRKLGADIPEHIVAKLQQESGRAE